jgi:hypothetical protein
MSTEIASIITELKEITNEIRNRSLELTKLRKRKTKLEEQLVKFLEEKKQPGIKYKGIAVIAEDKTKRVAKKKVEKFDDCVNVLRHYGVQNAEKICTELLESVKGNEVATKKVKITSSK